MPSPTGNEGNPLVAMSKNPQIGDRRSHLDTPSSAVSTSLHYEVPDKPNKDDYSTFQSINNKSHVANVPVSEQVNSPFAFLPTCIFASICLRQPESTSLDHRTARVQKQQSRGDIVSLISRRIVLLVSVIVAILACLRKRPFNDHYIIPGIPEWHWDHNIYISHSNSDTSTTTTTTAMQDFSDVTTNQNIALVAQVVNNRPLRTLSDVSSRLWRAYARQWGMDYAQYDSGRPSYDPKECFDKIIVLNTILDHQNLQVNQSSLHWSSHPPEKVRYDTMILLNPDSIVTNLDMNLFDAMLPDKNKLVAIAGFTDETQKLNSQSGIVVYNLRHKYADAVAKLWSDMAAPIDVTCGANNDLGMLLTAIATVMEPEEEAFDDLIHGIEESDDGFLGDRMVKFITPSVPGPRLELLMENLEDSKTDLLKTADAVCYRYYPRCEVIVT